MGRPGVKLEGESFLQVQESRLKRRNAQQGKHSKGAIADCYQETLDRGRLITDARKFATSA